MKRTRLVLMAFVALAVVVLLAWVAAVRWRAANSPLPQELRSAVAKSETFVKNHVTGGVGVVLSADVTTSLPRIVSVLAGSPAETAGLRADDLILRVNDSPTAGRTLAQVVDAIRGFSAGEVAVTVQRADSTNLTFTIHRASWSALGATNQAGAAPLPAGFFATNLPPGLTNSVIIAPSLPTTPNGTNLVR